MNGLEDALGDVAEQAKLYDVIDGAVRTARRRRRVARVAPVAAATTVVAALVAAALTLPDRTGTMTPEAPVVSWLPTRLEPEPNPPPLPADTPVGLGSLVYTSAGQDGWPPVLVTDDGRQYRLAEVLGGPTGDMRIEPTLSPDGRWLGETQAGSYVVRDLTGTARWRVDGDYALGSWSTNSRWLLLIANWQVGRMLRLHLLSGEQMLVTIPHPAQFWGAKMLASGEIAVVSPLHVRPPVLDVQVIPPTTGVQRSWVRRDLVGHLHDGEEFQQIVWWAPDETTVALQVSETTANPDGSVSYSAAAGLVLASLESLDVRRWPVAYEPWMGPPRAAPTELSYSLGARGSVVLAYPAEGILLYTHDHGRSRVDLLDPLTGTVRPAMRLPDNVLVYVRGRH